MDLDYHYSRYYWNCNRLPQFGEKEDAVGGAMTGGCMAAGCIMQIAITGISILIIL